MPEAFQVVVLGCMGGPREHNLSGYLISPFHQQERVCVDAGSLLSGIEAAIQKKNLDGAPLEVLHKQVKAFLISHAHLDHISGLVLNSQINTSKSIFGIDPTIDNLRDHIFNGRIWPNYGNEGVEPTLNKYHYIRLPLHEQRSIPGTSMRVETFLLSHPRGYPSTAFLIEYQDNYLLYFGDTSSDALEVEKHLTHIWKRIAPLIDEKKLRGILLECSYSHKDAESVVYGHLDTKLMMLELGHLADIVQTSLKGLNLVVTHRKESVRKGDDPIRRIEEEITQMNELDINFIFPSQGDKIVL